MRHSKLHNILHPNQRGFCQGKLCETQLDLLEFVQKAAESLKEGKQMDFSKALEKVGHERLHHKLAHYGVGGRTLSWMPKIFNQILTNLPHGKINGKWNSIRRNARC